jgi:N-hydroxyarylamine O-acetyltransferase
VGPYPQGALRYELGPSAVAAGGWRLVNDARAGYVGVDVSPAAVADRVEFLPAHRWLSTNPDSPWVKRLVVKNRDAVGSTALQGLVLTRLAEGGPRPRLVDHRAEWFDALADIFGERLVAYGADGRAALWDKVLRGHDEWMRASLRSGADADPRGPSRL